MGVPLPLVRLCCSLSASKREEHEALTSTKYGACRPLQSVCQSWEA